MLNRRYFTVETINLLCALVVSLSKSSIAEPIDFQRDVAPILECRCLSCHNDWDRRGGLSRQSAKAAGKGGESGKVIVPGEPESSYFLDVVIRSDGTAEMPKDESPLEAAEVDTIRRWIAGGAVWPN